jgi:hypothetical protein
MDQFTVEVVAWVPCVRQLHIRADSAAEAVDCARRLYELGEVFDDEDGILFEFERLTSPTFSVKSVTAVGGPERRRSPAGRWPPEVGELGRILTSEVLKDRELRQTLIAVLQRLEAEGAAEPPPSEP